MSEKTIRVKPKKGVLLAGLPADGGDVEIELAEEWLEAGLVEKVPKKPAKPDEEV